MGTVQSLELNAVGFRTCRWMKLEVAHLSKNLSTLKTEVVAVKQKLPKKKFVVNNQNNQPLWNGLSQVTHIYILIDIY